MKINGTILSARGPVRAFFAIVFALFVWTAIPASALAGQPVVKITPPMQLAATTDDDDVNDPLEPVNRLIFGFNEIVHQNLLGPVADIYNRNLPQTMRTGVSNFLTNLSSPVTFANNLLQGDFFTALDIVVRFLVNSTVGIGGIADVVSEVDGKPRDEDFGQTLGVWGVGEGLYLVLPVFGPSNPRDLVGKFFVDPYFDPFGQWVGNSNRDNVSYAHQALDGVDEFAGVVDELRQIRKTSVDYYAAIRSLYRQKRKSEISNGEDLDLPPIPNLGYDLAPEDFEQPLAGAPGRRSAAK